MSFMVISKDRCTLILTVVSLAVLAIDYGLLSFDTYKFNIGIVSLSGSSSENMFFISILGLSIVLASNKPKGSDSIEIVILTSSR